MKSIIEWLTVNWTTIVIVLGGLITILNAATQVWHEKAGAVRVLQFIISALSLVRSKGADPGALGALKLPLVPELPPKSTTRSGILGSVLLVMIVSLAGCANWQTTAKASLDAAGAATTGYRTAVELHYNAKCLEAARACAPRGTTDCPGYLECDATRHKHYPAMKGIHAARAAGYVAIVSAIEKDAAAAVARAWALVKELAERLGKEGLR